MVKVIALLLVVLSRFTSIGGWHCDKYSRTENKSVTLQSEQHGLKKSH